MMTRKGEKKLTQEKSDISRFMAQSSKHLISEFNKKIAECDRRIQEIIAGDEDLRRNFEIITGRQSGTSVNTPPHVSPFANKLIKALLTQAALASVNFCPQMAVYYRRLVDAGKKKPVAVNNVKNKLLHIITKINCCTSLQL